MVLDFFRLVLIKIRTPDQFYRIRQVNLHTAKYFRKFEIKKPGLENSAHAQFAFYFGPYSINLQNLGSGSPK